VLVRGDVSVLMDLGSGLDLDATGADNVVLYGGLLGGRPGELRRQTSEILEWAGLSDFADVPVGSYSAGMLARLAFATATAGHPDVLLIDEILAVGDASFVARSKNRIQALADRGCTIVIVTHAHEQLRELATRAIWLDHGLIRADGQLDGVLAEYSAAIKRPELLPGTGAHGGAR
jgi:ABC-type polysaccharide/polyol phosphate transport system ATPase subunit